MLARRLVGFGLASLALVLASGSSRAHFELQSPPSWYSQDAVGSPQKLGPCGDEGGGSATNVVTSYQPGQTIAVTIDEKIFHPGHYRIALAVNNRSELPPEPTVTPGTGTPCGTVPVESPVTFPVLADGVFDHTAPFSSPQTVMVTLPTSVTCSHCTLQVLEFMSQHPLNNPGGCFYHHCADIAIGMPASDGGGPSNDAGTSSGDGGGGGPDASTGMDAGAPGADVGNSGGCSCSVDRAETNLGALVASALAVTALFGRRKKSRR